MIYLTLCFLQLVSSRYFLVETEDSNKTQKRPRWTGLKHHAQYETGFDYNDKESEEEDGVAEKDKAAGHDLVETEDGAAEDSGKNDIINTNTNQKAVDYQLKATLWGKKRN